MANLSTYTYAQLLNDVKIESRNSGNTELDAWLTGVINEEIARYTALQQYPQMFVKNSQLNMTAATSAVSLPSDLQHIDRTNIRYFTSGDQFGRILSRYDRFRVINSGPPFQFIRQNNQLLITPSPQIATGDYLLIDYWSLPILASGDLSAIFPIPELIPVVKAAVIARSVTFDDPKQWQRYKSDEREKYISSQSVENG